MRTPNPRRPWTQTEDQGIPRTLLRDLSATLSVPVTSLLGLRVRDVDLTRGCIFVPGAPPLLLSSGLAARLEPQLERARRMHKMDMRAGLGGVAVPTWRDPELISRLPGWYFVFPSPRVRQDASGRWLREPMRARAVHRLPRTQPPRPEDRRR